MSKFTLQLKNNSLNPGTFCVFQVQPNLTAHGSPFTLAWYVLGCNPTCYANFTWTVDYSLQWSESGTLADGVQFITGGDVDADPEIGDRYNFGISGPAYTFGKKAAAGSLATIGVNTDDTVQNSECSIAIAVAGKAVAAVQAGPNQAITFTPLPTYWVSFGNFTEGAVVDIASMCNAQELDYGGLGVYTLSYTLDARNKWNRN